MERHVETEAGRLFVTSAFVFRHIFRTQPFLNFVVNVNTIGEVLSNEGRITSTHQSSSCCFSERRSSWETNKKNRLQSSYNKYWQYITCRSPLGVFWWWWGGGARTKRIEGCCLISVYLSRSIVFIVDEMSVIVTSNTFKAKILIISLHRGKAPPPFIGVLRSAKCFHVTMTHFVFYLEEMMFALPSGLAFYLKVKVYFWGLGVCSRV